jgi:hypothetical protein
MTCFLEAKQSRPYSIALQLAPRFDSSLMDGDRAHEISGAKTDRVYHRAPLTRVPHSSSVISATQLFLRYPPLSAPKSPAGTSRPGIPLTTSGATASGDVGDEPSDGSCSGQRGLRHSREVFGRSIDDRQNTEPSAFSESIRQEVVIILHFAQKNLLQAYVSMPSCRLKT